ncbi:prephenate dehydrogenase [Romboutsia sp.]|uniref:prephenate dehydrogenase n=1 Tax=Romboutsia sp. TaxID=1965302 RepID=UPI003F3D5771
MIITIVGLGVIGGSYALSLKEKYNNIFAIDINKKSLEEAKKNQIIKDGANYLSEKSYEIIAKTDILVLAIYPSMIGEFIDNYKSKFKEGLIITDVAGIKAKVMEDIDEKLPKNVDFIFTHPMAGKEKKGFSYASSSIFKGANFIIIPTAENKDFNIKIIENLAKDMGFENIKYISKEEHDKIIAFTSQLPHVIAVSLINSDNLGVDTGKFTGDSYRELTRIANINEDLWSELFLYNKENLINMIEGFEKQISIIKSSLKEDNINELKGRFIESTKRREAL